jgi:hypothetical protein
MADNRLKQTSRKRTLIAPVIFGSLVLALLLGIAFFKGRTPAPASPPPSSSSSPAPVQIAEPKPMIVPPPPLGRREIIEGATLAAASYAAGEASATDQSSLIGRRFSLRIPFGCDGPQASPGSAQAFYEIDAVRRTIKLVARPGDWTALPAIQQPPAGGDVEDVEGFWLTRPWSYAEACPARRVAPVPATPTAVAAQVLGLAQVFHKEGSRLLRRDGRAYEFVQKAPGDLPTPPAGAYRLVLEGKVVGFGGGRAIRCWSETPDHRPICIYGIEFERVAFEDAAGQMLAEWRD